MGNEHNPLRCGESKDPNESSLALCREGEPESKDDAGKILGLRTSRSQRSEVSRVAQRLQSSLSLY